MMYLDVRDRVRGAGTYISHTLGDAGDKSQDQEVDFDYSAVNWKGSDAFGDSGFALLAKQMSENGTLVLDSSLDSDLDKSFTFEDLSESWNDIGEIDTGSEWV